MSEAASPAPRVAFVVPAYNEERYLGETLGRIHAASRELGLDYEIVVADDASTDATARIAAEGGARVIAVSNRQISKTRNDGARAAAGERLVFVDGDTHVNVAVLRAAMAALDAGDVGGGAHVAFPASAPRWAHASARGVIAFMDLFDWAAGCFVFCTRAAFEAAGGFDERHFAGEEIMLSIAMKKQGRFRILRETVETSARKTHGRSLGQMLWLTLKLLAHGLSGVRRRETTQFWYDGRR